MKVYKYLSMLILAFTFYTGNAVAQGAEETLTAEQEGTGREAARDVLKKQGHMDADIEKILQMPSSSEALSVCDACKKVELWIKDTDTNCGGKGNALTCGYYMATTLITWIKGHKDTVCAAAAANKVAICGAAPTAVDTALNTLCGNFSCATAK